MEVTLISAALLMFTRRDDRIVGILFGEQFNFFDMYGGVQKFCQAYWYRATPEAHRTTFIPSDKLARVPMNWFNRQTFVAIITHEVEICEVGFHHTHGANDEYGRRRAAGRLAKYKQKKTPATPFMLM